MFACAPGATSDGHRFAASAATVGAAALLVQHPVEVAHAALLDEPSGPAARAS